MLAIGPTQWQHLAISLNKYSLESDECSLKRLTALFIQPKDKFSSTPSLYCMHGLPESLAGYINQISFSELRRVASHSPLFSVFNKERFPLSIEFIGSVFGNDLKFQNMANFPSK